MKRARRRRQVHFVYRGLENRKARKWCAADLGALAIVMSVISNDLTKLSDEALSAAIAFGHGADQEATK